MRQIKTKSGRIVDLVVHPGGGVQFTLSAASNAKRPRLYTFRGMVNSYDLALGERGRMPSIEFRPSDSPTPSAFKLASYKTRDRWPELWREIELEVVPAIREFASTPAYALAKGDAIAERRLRDIVENEAYVYRLETQLAAAKERLAKLREA